MAITLTDQLKKYGPSALPFDEWRQEANKIRFYGLSNEEILDILGYPVNPDGTPIKFTYKGDKSGFDYRTGNREKQADVRSQKASVQTAGEDVYNKGVVAAKGSGLQEHHRRVMDVYAPFFEGLNAKDQKELAEWFVTEGAPLGNVRENLLAMPPKQHEQLHKWLKDNYIQSKTGTPLINLKNLSLNERFVPALTFLEQIQPAIDEQTTNILKSGEQVLENAPVKIVSKNGAVRLAMGAIRNPLVRAGLVGGGVALSTINAGMVRAETEGDDSLLAKTRRGLADAEVALDTATVASGATGVGLPVAAATELASTAVGLTAMGVDAFVTNAKRAEEAVKRGGQLSFGIRGVRLTFPELGISERLGFN